MGRPEDTGWPTDGAHPCAGHTSVSVVLDRYGHLYEGNDADVLARLDSFASVTADDTPSRWIPRVFRGARSESEDQSADPQVADLGKPGGRGGTRTPDIRHVKPTL